MSELTPNSIYQRLVEAGNDWAAMRHSAEMLEKNCKNAFSQYFNEHKASGKGVEEAKHLAQAEPAYQILTENLVDAQRAALVAKVKYDSAQTYFEAWRTLEANHRAAARAGT